MSPTRVTVDDDEQQLADLEADLRRLRSRLATTAVTGSHDEFTAAATPSTTYPLTYIPLSGTCLMALNGHVQREGVDYSVNYDTGVVTVSATQASGDKITFRYLVTDWLVARSIPPDLGCLEDTFDRTANSSSPNPPSDGGSSWVVYAGTWGIDAGGHLYNSAFSNWSSGGTASAATGPDPMGNEQFVARDAGRTRFDLTIDIHHDDSATAWLAVNFDPTTRGAYLLEAGQTQHRVWRAPSNVGASRVLLDSLTGWTAFTPGTSTIRFVHDGAGHFDVYQDGTHLSSFTDTATVLTGTWVGVGITGNMSTSNWFDNSDACTP